MQYKPENVNDIVLIIQSKFRSFGGGKSDNSNPIAAALQKMPAQFAAGVDIKDVVMEVIHQLDTMCGGILDNAVHIGGTDYRISEDVINKIREVLK